MEQETQAPPPESGKGSLRIALTEKKTKIFISVWFPHPIKLYGICNPILHAINVSHHTQVIPPVCDSSPPKELSTRRSINRKSFGRREVKNGELP